MNFTPEQFARVAAVLRSNDKRFIALVHAAGLDPAQDLVGADLQRVDFGTDNYEKFDFAFTDLHGARLDQARGLQAAMFFRARFDETTRWPDGLRAAIAGFDVEAAARAVILAGRPPPVSWRPHIRNLDLRPSKDEKKSKSGAAAFSRTDLLASLANLQMLTLNDTQVSDVAPLASLANLRTLHLGNTRVSDLAPLAGLQQRGLQIVGFEPVNPIRVRLRRSLNRLRP